MDKQNKLNWNLFFGDSTALIEVPDLRNGAIRLGPLSTQNCIHVSLIILPKWTIVFFNEKDLVEHNEHKKKIPR